MTEDHLYRVSISITTYNMEHYIQRAIESVLAQQVDFAYEIVVVDDASKDGTVAIVRQLAAVHPQIKLYTSEQNAGLIHNFVKSVRLAKGKYIACLDADDYWIDDNKLQKQVAVLEAGKNIGYSFHNYFKETDGTDERAIAFNEFDFESIENKFLFFLSGFSISISSLFFRKALFTEDVLAAFEKQNFVAQDLPFSLHLALQSEGHYFPEPMSVYNIRKNSMSRQEDIHAMIANRIRGFEIGEYFIEQYPIAPALRRKRNFDFHLMILLKYWQLGDFSKVSSYASKVILADIIKYQPKSLYIYIGSKWKFFYKLFKGLVLRSRN